VLAPAWTTDWITEAGRDKLAAAGIAPPGPAPRRAAGPIPLVLGRPVLDPRGLDPTGLDPRGLDSGGANVRCPRCGHAETERIAAFSATACRELLRCPACREPFEHVKEI
jgi:ring-1,2-phenylacetyl-CoA epoxidase subunit PaaD